MTIHDVRQDTNFKVTVEQIGRLERGLMAMRESAVGSPEALNTIALIQYQEIARLRAELDAAMGFAEEPSDLIVSLQGPSIGLGVAPSSVIATTLSNVRAAVQTVSLYLTKGQWTSGGRFPDLISSLSDFRFMGAASGSVRIKLNLPEPQSLFPEFDQEPTVRSVHLMLEAVGWVSSDAHIYDFERRIEDPQLMRLLLTQVRRVTPPRNGLVQRMEFSGRLTDPENSYTLSHLSASRIRDALNEVSAKATRVTEEGKLRAVDIDSRVFHLRQRPDDRPDMRCEIQPDIIRRALDFLVGDATVIVEGVQQFDERGRASYLSVEDIYDVG